MRVMVQGRGRSGPDDKKVAEGKTAKEAVARIVRCGRARDAGIWCA